ncbi:MAG: right-handed parallel beta-helix repeat-containing protein, partial [Bdellovibrionota bacterium]
NNRILDIYLSAADGDANHDDAVQGFALNGAIYDNVIIENTYIVESTSATRPFKATHQGISVFDGLYTNMKVRGNVVLAGGYHGISIYGGKNVVIEKNTVISTYPGRTLWISAPKSKEGVLPDNTIVQNNVASSYTLASGVQSINNFTVSNPSASFVQFDLSNALYDLHPAAGSAIYGKGAGAY